MEPTACVCSPTAPIGGCVGNFVVDFGGWLFALWILGDSDVIHTNTCGHARSLTLVAVEAAGDVNLPRRGHVDRGLLRGIK